MEEERAYEVWSEGYAATGERGYPVRLGTGYGNTFEDAVRELAARERWGDLFDPERLTHWGCRLFRSREVASGR